MMKEKEITERTINKKLNELSENKNEMSDASLIQLKKEYEKEIMRMTLSSIVSLGIIYGIAGLSFWYLSKVTFFILAYFFALSFLMAYVHYKFSYIKKERKQSYQDLLDMCKKYEGKHK